MVRKGYVNPSQEFYLVYDIADEIEKEMQNIRWDITRLAGYSAGRGSGLPFAASLTELMSTIVR
jgi:hypothetical protein